MGVEGAPLVPVAEGFNDVFETDGYNLAVRWVSANNITGGYDDGCFGPNDANTRKQAVVILWRYAELEGIDVSAGEDINILSCSDIAEVAEYAISVMQWACGAGVPQGVQSSDGGMLLNPKGETTRAQLATVMMRFCGEPEMVEAAE